MKKEENSNDYIHALLDSNLSVIPITEGDKKPHGILGQQHTLLKIPPTHDLINTWLTAGVTSWAIASGKVSGNLVTLDFDEKHYPGLYEKWYTRLSQEGKDFVALCYKNKTRNNGTHLRYRTETPQRTTKLARRMEWSATLNKDEIVTTAEVRGEGAYALIPPSAGYVTLQESILDLPLVPDEIHEEFIDILRTFNEIIDEPATEYEYKEGDTTSQDRPGDRLNQLMPWGDILGLHGWVEEYGDHWRRPGKKEGEGISATTGYEGLPMLYIFSTSAAPFEVNKGYSKFHVFSLLNHNGDFKEAAKVAAAMYPQDNTIEKAGRILSEIPSDIEKVKLIGVLDPILKNLLTIDKMVAENFILYNIKGYFKITKEEAKKYITRLNSLRNERLRNEKEQKTVAEKAPLILDRDIDFQEVYDAISEIGIVSEETLYILTAVVISAKLRLNPPLWLFLIGVPSSNKTESVSMYGDMDQVFTLDTLTENAFVSGYIPPDGSDPQDMLPLLDGKCFIVKDLNTIFSLNEEMVKKILGDLTSIFDGKFEKYTATRGMLSYSSLFSMIGCITPSILIKHYNYATQLGPRFFFLRLPDLTEEQLESSFYKSWNETDRKGKIAKARQLASSYAAQLINKIEDYETTVPSEKVKQKINNIALFMSKARGIAISNKNTFQKDGEAVTYYDISNLQIEQPWRIFNQLKSLLRVLAFMRHKAVYDEEEIQIIKPIILSTMPVDRAEIFSILARKCAMSARDLSKEIGGKSVKTIQRSLKELEILGLVDAYKDPQRNNSGKAPWLYFVHQKFADVIDAPTPSPESMSELKSEKSVDYSKNEEDDSF